MIGVIEDMVAGGPRTSTVMNGPYTIIALEVGVVSRQLDHHHLAQTEVVVLLPGGFSQQVRVALDRRDHVVVGVEHGW